MEVFAHDSLMGRDVGSEGIKKAQAYIKKRLVSYDLKPAGVNNSYFQAVPIKKLNLHEQSVKITYHIEETNINLVFGEDITFIPSFSFNRIDYNELSEIIYIGNGIHIPERGMLPYEKVDVKGKVVLFELSAPSFLKGDEFAYKAGLFERIREAKKQGAQAVLLYYPKKNIEKQVFKEFHALFTNEIYDLDTTGTIPHFVDFGLDYVGLIRYKRLKNLFQLEGSDLTKMSDVINNNTFYSHKLRGTITSSYIVNSEKIHCNNLLAVIEGSDSLLKNEYVVVTAHLDHMGIGEPVKGDSIYNGAWDNASGSAALLSMAEMFSKLPEAPKRSVIFFWNTAEERGLLGSNFYASYPTVPDSCIVACVNMDMIGMLFESTDFIPMGYNFSNISVAVDSASAYVGIERDKSNKYPRMYFDRSDHFSFVQKGVPSIFIWGGQTPVGSLEKNEEVYSKWEKNIYHSPQDDMTQEFVPKAFLDALQLNFLTVFYLANELEEIKWYTNNKYYEQYVAGEE